MDLEYNVTVVHYIKCTFTLQNRPRNLSNPLPIANFANRLILSVFISASCSEHSSCSVGVRIVFVHNIALYTKDS